MYYAGGNRSGSVLSGAGCGASEGRRNYWRVLEWPEELRLVIVSTGKPRTLHLVGRKSARPLGRKSCQPAFRIRNVSIPDQNENGSLEKKNNMPPAHSGRSMFRLGIVYGMQSTFRRRHVAEPERGALVRDRTVYGILYFVEGRPQGGWKMWPGCASRQHTPTRFARIFGVCHTFATIP